MTNNLKPQAIIQLEKKIGWTLAKVPFNKWKGTDEAFQKLLTK